MRILIYGINYAPEPTGTGKYTGEMAGWLAARGHDVRVVTAPPYYPDWQVAGGYAGWRYRWERSNVGRSASVWRSPLWVPKQPNGIKRLAHLASFAISSAPLVLAQARWQPALAVCIAPTLFCAPMALAAARLSRASTWLHVQDFEVDAAFGMGILRSPFARRRFIAAERILFSKFDRVSTISERMVERLGEKGVPGERRVLFPNWTDVSLVRPLECRSTFRTELGISDSQTVALYAGNIGEKQGLETMVKAAQRTEDDQQLVWVIAGAGSARSRLEDLSSGCSNLRWLSLQPTDRLNELLNLADIHILPQRANAADLVMPSKLTNMLASGKPVVATADPETQLARVVSGRGTVVPPGDAESLAGAVLELTGNGPWRRALGAAARKYAEDYLDRDKIMRGFEQAAEELVAGQD